MNKLDEYLAANYTKGEIARAKEEVDAAMLMVRNKTTPNKEPRTPYFGLTDKTTNFRASFRKNT